MNNFSEQSGMRIQSWIEFLYLRKIHVHIMRTWSAYFFLLLTTMIIYATTLFHIIRDELVIVQK